MVFLNPAMVAHNLMKAVNKRSHYDICTKLLVGVVSLSAFEGNFVLDKVCLGLISVRLFRVKRCLHQSGASDLSPVYKGCPLFGGAIIRGFTIKTGKSWPLFARQLVPFNVGCLFPCGWLLWLKWVPIFMSAL